MTAASDSEPSNAFTPPTKVLGREARVVRKRFYKAVTVAPVSGGFAVHLDGRGVRTPAKAPLLLPVEALAAALAEEWQAQGEELKPATMPLTTLACTAIDAVANTMPAVAEDIGSYAMSDLLCYRAEAPDGLVERQAAGWDPLLAWAERELTVTFERTSGLMPVAQSPRVAGQMVVAVGGLDALQLAAVHVLTSLMGSAILALAVLRQRLDIDTAWRLAHIDEHWQIQRWGTDAEAEVRQAARHKTATAAAKVLLLSDTNPGLRRPLDGAGYQT